MNSSRRNFLGRAALTAAGIVLAQKTTGFPLSLRTSSPLPENALLFGESDLPRIRETLKHPRFAKFWKTMIDADLEADNRFLIKELQLNDHVKHLLRARQILERTAFVYAVTGDTNQAATAKTAIDRILQYKRWDYFLDGGKYTIGLQRAPETTIAMCCALEWLGETLDPGVRKEAERQIAEKGAPACYRTLYGMKYPDRVLGWGFDPESNYPLRFDLSRWPLILNSTNLKMIPIAGLGMAGCFLHGRHPDAGRWVEMAVSSAKAFSVMFGSDGCYDEGVGYWGYTALHLTLLVDVVKRVLGIDETGIINYPGTVRYGLRMSMPTADRDDDCVNFGDAWAVGDVSVAAWTARRYRDPVAQYVATSVGEITSHIAAIWFDPTLQPSAPGPELLDVRFANDVVVSRSGWEVGAGVVGLRSGGPTNHEHADRNSVIFKAYGERLFHDPFHAAYSYTQPDWLLRKTEAHTAVLINGKGHQYHDGHEGTNASRAEARVVDYRADRERLIVTSDATDAYQLVDENVDMVRRTVIFLKPDILLLCDRVRLKTGTGNVQCRYQVHNGDGKGVPSVAREGFSVRRPGASLRAKVVGLKAVSIRTANHPLPPESGIHPFIEVESPDAREHLLLTLCTAQQGTKEHGDISVERRGMVWQVRGQHNGRRISLSVDMASDLPIVAELG
jgi:hypothetical protein